MHAGVTVYAEEEGTKIWEERVRLEFLSKKYFKPFFPYYGKVIMHLKLWQMKFQNAPVKVGGDSRHVNHYPAESRYTLPLQTV